MLHWLRKELASSLSSFEEKLNFLTGTIDHKLTAFSEANNTNASTTRTEIKQALEAFKKDLAQSIEQFNSIQKDNFYALLNKQGEQNTDTGNRLDSMRQTLEKKIGEMQQGNEQKLEQMRITVDEKLQQTLEARLGESFKLVSERLEAVHKGPWRYAATGHRCGRPETGTQQCKNKRGDGRVPAGEYTGTNSYA